MALMRFRRIRRWCPPARRAGISFFSFPEMEKRKSLAKREKISFWAWRKTRPKRFYDGTAAAEVIDTNGPIHIRAVVSSRNTLNLAAT